MAPPALQDTSVGRRLVWSTSVGAGSGLACGARSMLLERLPSNSGVTWSEMVSPVSSTCFVEPTRSSVVGTREQLPQFASSQSFGLKQAHVTLQTDLCVEHFFIACFAAFDCVFFFCVDVAFFVCNLCTRWLLFTLEVFTPFISHLVVSQRINFLPARTISPTPHVMTSFIPVCVWIL